MWQFLIYRGTYKWLFYGLIVLLIGAFGSYFYYLKQKSDKLEKQVFYLEKQLADCKKVNADLVKELQVQQQKYQAKVNKLLKLINKKPKVIKIPKVITKKVYVPAEDCQKMAIMIDEFIKIQKEKEKEK